MRLYGAITEKLSLHNMGSSRHRRPHMHLLNKTPVRDALPMKYQSVDCVPLYAILVTRKHSVTFQKCHLPQQLHCKMTLPT